MSVTVDTARRSSAASRGGDSMDTRIDEISDGIYRLSTHVPDVGGPPGMTFNQFLVDAEEPLLFHAGHRNMYPLVSAAVARIRPVADLRWIAFGHVEADECGAMNSWLADAPRSEVAHGLIGCMVSLDDLCDRPPVPLADGQVIDLGGKRVRHIDTPHLPHGWDARVLYEETTGTLLAGDLFTHLGDGPAVTTGDVVGPAVEAESMFRSMALAPDTSVLLDRLADLEPTTLALMHGSSFQGDGGGALRELSDALDERFLAAS
jgi:flavorubredoxin